MSLPIEQHNLLGFVGHQLKLSESQGAALRKMFDQMVLMHEQMSEMKLDVKEKFEECQIMVQEVRDSVTLTDAECFQMQQAVKSKANALTKDRFKEGNEKFKEMVGRYRRMIWSKLKERFSVAKYSHIRRIDFEDALEFAKTFQPEDYI